MKRLVLIYVLMPVIALTVFNIPSFGDEKPEGVQEMTCPESCESARKNCELSCTQIVGGGAKSEKRRECIYACGDELEDCRIRCADPTPRPTVEPEAYHDKTCRDACVYRNKDCNENCTKYVGGGAKSAKRNACVEECGEKLDQCEDRCVNPAPRPRIDRGLHKNNSCASACANNRIDCEESCSIYTDGGAEGGKREECIMSCNNIENDCIETCND
ncbi:MAG: hypothetical protein RIG61_03470 [Deltaproteobacteria bacterium]